MKPIAIASFQDAANSVKCSANQLEEAAIAAGNEVEYNSLNNKSSVCSADSHKKQAEAIVANREEECIHWKKSAEVTRLSVLWLERSVESLENDQKS